LGNQASSFAERSEAALASSRRAALAASAELAALTETASPLDVAAAADRLVQAAGRVWMHAHRVAESRSA
jgi:hypothetical protein